MKATADLDGQWDDPEAAPAVSDCKLNLPILALLIEFQVLNPGGEDGEDLQVSGWVAIQLCTPIYWITVRRRRLFRDAVQLSPRSPCRRLL
jgi:hypothetical protein